MPRKFLAILTMAVSALCAWGGEADSTAKVNYIPQIHGTFRGRFEASTEHGDYRFQVRNARLSVNGMISSFADYFLQADVCDRGTFKMLDAWARLHITPEIGIQAGQFRMPFGVDPFRGPHTYYFANRSFIGKQTDNVRAVGIKAIWNPASLPLTLEAGAFNPTTISDHNGWHNKLAYSAKLTYTISNVTLATGFKTIAPDSVRINLADLGVTWKSGRWIAEAEYMYKHYTRNRHKAAHAYNVFADYHLPLNSRIFNRLSFQARFDGLTAHSFGKRNDKGCLITDDPARNRLTLGATISHIRKKNLFVDIRANYENYFYHHGYEPSADNGDKAVIELVVRF